MKLNYFPVCLLTIAFLTSCGGTQFSSNTKNVGVPTSKSIEQRDSDIEKGPETPSTGKISEEHAIIKSESTERTISLPPEIVENINAKSAPGTNFPEQVFETPQPASLDKIPPPELKVFLGSIGKTADGEVLLSWEYPDDLSDYKKLSIRSLKGEVPPSADCTSDGNSIFEINSPLITKTFVHQTGSKTGEKFSYRVCILDDSGNLTASNVANGVYARNSANVDSLKSFSAMTGVAQGMIKVSLVYPSDVSKFARVEVRRVGGDTAPASCSSGETIYSQVERFENIELQDNTKSNFGAKFSYLVCVKNISDAVWKASATGVRAYDNLPPPELENFTAVPASLPGKVVLTFDMPSDLRDVSNIEIRRLTGKLAPTCSTGTRVHALASLTNGTFEDDVGSPGATISYAACVFDASGNVNDSKKVISVLTKFCTPYETKCDFSLSKQGICNAAGSDYVYSVVGGQCGANCSPGTKTCDTVKFMQGTCNSSGSGFENFEFKPPFCNAGSFCVPGSKVCDNTARKEGTCNASGTEATGFAFVLGHCTLGSACIPGNETCDDQANKLGICNATGTSYTYTRTSNRCGMGAVCVPNEFECGGTANKQQRRCNVSGSAWGGYADVNGQCGYVAPQPFQVTGIGAFRHAPNGKVQIRLTASNHAGAGKIEIRRKGISQGNSPMASCNEGTVVHTLTSLTSSTETFFVDGGGEASNYRACEYNLSGTLVGQVGLLNIITPVFVEPAAFGVLVYNVNWYISDNSGEHCNYTCEYRGGHHNGTNTIVGYPMGTLAACETVGKAVTKTSSVLAYDMIGLNGATPFDPVGCIVDSGFVYSGKPNIARFVGAASRADGVYSYGRRICGCNK